MGVIIKWFFLCLTFSEYRNTGKLQFIDKSTKYPLNMLLNYISKIN